MIMMRGSRRISWRKASFSAWRIDFCGIRASPKATLHRGGRGEAFSSIPYYHQYGRHGRHHGPHGRGGGGYQPGGGGGRNYGGGGDWASVGPGNARASIIATAVPHTSFFILLPSQSKT